MVKNKGFIHIVEAVLISMIIVSMIPALLQPVSFEENWGRIRLKKTGRDILKTLDQSGELDRIMSFNSTEVRQILEGGGNRRGILQQRGDLIQYGVRTENAYKNTIRVGFNCTGGCDPDAEKNRIERILAPTWFNGRFIKFQVFPFNWKKFQGNNQYYDIDVIFLNGDDQVDEAENYWGGGNSKIKTFLERGNGIVEYVNLTSADMNTFQENVFGLAGSSTGGTGDLEFVNRDDTTKPNYEPSKIFYGTGSFANDTQSAEGNWTVRGEKHNITVEKVSDGYNVTISDGTTHCEDCKEGDSFPMGGYDFTIDKVKEMETGPYGGEYVVWFRHGEGYEFSNFVEDGDIKPINDEWDRAVLEVPSRQEAGFVVNESLGKVAWISKGGSDDVKGLVQAGVIWSAGKGWWNVLRSPGRDAVSVSRFGINQQEVYEPYRVVLNLWYIY